MDIDKEMVVGLLLIILIVFVALAFAGCAEKRTSCTQNEWLVRSDCQ